MTPEPPAPLVTYQDLARMIDHALVKPELTGDRCSKGWNWPNATRWPRRPCVRAISTWRCARWQGSAVRPGQRLPAFRTVPQNTATKLYETRDLLRRGAREIDMVIAISKLLSREFQHVQTELLQMSELCHKEGAMLKVILENAYLTDELKIIACRCCERAEVDFVQDLHRVCALRIQPGRPEADAQVSSRGNRDQGGGRTAHGGRCLEVHAAGCSRIGTDCHRRRFWTNGRRGSRVRVRNPVNVPDGRLAPVGSASQ